MKFNIKTALIIAAAIIGALIFTLSGKSKVNTSETLMTLDDFIVESFKSELPAINSSLPQKVDESTTLLSISYADKKIFSRYRISSDAPSVQMIDLISAQAQNTLKKQVCLNDSKSKLLEAGVDFVEIYQNADGKTILELTVNKTDCLNLTAQ